MFENLYTTKMSSNKKIIHRRFSKIISGRSGISKMLSLVMPAIIVLTVFGASIAAAAVCNTDSYKIIVYNNSNEIMLANTPFIKNNEIYMPLREIFEKVGVLDRNDTFVTYEDGKIKAAAGKIVYHMEIGSNKLLRGYSFDPYTEPRVIATAGNAPILKNSVTYVPYEYISCMLNTHMGKGWEVDYRAYDKNGEDKTTEVLSTLCRPLTYFEAVKIAPEYETETEMCVNTVVKCLENNTKEYIVPEAAEKLMSEYFGGKVSSVYAAELYPDGNYRVTFSFYTGNKQNKQILATEMMKCENGTFLIANIRRENHV